MNILGGKSQIDELKQQLTVAEEQLAESERQIRNWLHTIDLLQSSNQEREEQLAEMRHVVEKLLLQHDGLARQAVFTDEWHEAINEARQALSAAPKRGRVVFEARLDPGMMLDVDATIAIQLGLAEARKRGIGAVVTVREAE